MAKNRRSGNSRFKRVKERQAGVREDATGTGTATTLRYEGNPDWEVGSANGVNQPSAREYPAMTDYVTSSGSTKAILFGGYTSGGSNNGFDGDTWLYDGTQWTQQITGMSPSPRDGAMMTVDGSNNVWLFGGYSLIGGTVTYFNDVWEWPATNTGWVNKTPTSGSQPPVRWDGGFTYDAQSNLMVLFGGRGVGTANNGFLSDTWTWNGSAWSQPTQSPAPSPRDGFNLVYDPALGSGDLVLAGGLGCSGNGCTASYLSDTWEWTGSAWVSNNPLTGFPVRGGYSMAYDPTVQCLVAFGGDDATTAYNQTWETCGNAWTQWVGVASPKGRFGAAMTYDASSGEMIMFGGMVDDGTISGDTTTYDRKVLTVTTSTAPAYSAQSNISEGEVVPFQVTVGNPSNQQRTATAVSVTLPAGFSSTGQVRINDSTQTITTLQNIQNDLDLCTSTTSPTCTTTSHTISLSSFTLAGDASLQFYVMATATGEDATSLASGSLPQGCPAANTDPATSGGQGTYYPSIIKNSSPIVYYRMDDSVGSTTAKDSSGYAFNGTYSSTGVTLGVPGELSAGDADTAASFDGSSGRLTMPNGFASLSNGLTFETMVYPTSAANSNARLIEIGSGTSGTASNEISLFRNGTGDGVVFQVANSNSVSGSIAASGLLKLNAWNRIAATLTPISGNSTNDEARLYRDGILVASGQVPIPTNGVTHTQDYLGDSGYVSGTYFQGTIDDTAIYASPLSETVLDEHVAAATSAVAGGITAIADSPSTGVWADQIRDLQPNGYWRLGEVSGSTTAVDDSGNAQNGTYSSHVSLGQPGAIKGDNDTSASWPGGSTTAYVQIPDSAKVDLTNNFTIDAWVDPTSLASPNPILAKTLNGIAAPYDFFINTSGALELALGNGTTQTTTTSSLTVPTNQWSHVTVTRSGNTVWFYLSDGASNPTASFGTVANSTSALLRIGATDNNSYTFNGGIDEVSLIPTVMSATTEQYLTSYGANPAPPDEGQASAYYGPTNQGVALPISVCDNRLGIENWWSYVTRNLGGQQTANVNVSNGNMVIEAHDSTPIQADGRLAFGLTRAYNSQDTTSLQTPSSFGEGWQLNLDSLGAADGAISPAGLSVPSIEGLTQTSDVTLIDSDGTHLVFTPNSVPQVTASGTTGMLGGLLSNVKTLLGGGSSPTLCVDQTYNAPAGVHLDLWRYIAIPNGSACGSGAAGEVVGYAAESPNRLRYQFAATGELMDIIDPAGVDLQYVYSSPITALVDKDPTSQLTSLGSLQGVIEATSTCTASNFTNASATACRAFRLSYADQSAQSPTLCSTTIPSAGSAICIKDPANRPTVYLFNAAGAVSTKQLTAVDNPDGSSESYTYGTQANSCGATTLMCSATDESGNTTSFTYAAAPGGATLPDVLSKIQDPTGVNTTMNYHGGSYTEVQTDPTATTACSTAPTRCQDDLYENIDGAGRVGTLNVGTADGTIIRTTNYTWDTAGNTCQLSPTATPQVDNDLCTVTSLAYDTSQITTPNATTTTLYDPEGDPLDVHQTLTSGTSRDTTYGYHLQYVQSGGTAACVDYKVNPTVAKKVTQTTGVSTLGCNGNTPSKTLYVLSDKTQLLDPLGNAAGNGTTGNSMVTVQPSYNDYVTTYYDDDNASVAPNSMPATSRTAFCSGPGSGSSNTGLVCETDAPASANVAAAGSNTCAYPSANTVDPQHNTAPYDRIYTYWSCTRDEYDQNGAKTLVYSPDATASSTGNNMTPGVGNPTSYVYYGSSDVDMSGTSLASGWLKAVADPLADSTTNPTKHFVVFGYDAAGNVVRTWDRNQTSAAGIGLSSYPGTAAVPPYEPSTMTAVPFAETDYGPAGQTAGYGPQTAVSPAAWVSPWRYLQQSVDPVGDITAYQYDSNGNLKLLCPPREFTSAGTGKCNTSSTFVRQYGYDKDDNQTTAKLPLGNTGGGTPGLTTTTYDSYGNPLTVMDPRGTTTTYTYNAADQMTSVSEPRSASVTETTTNTYDGLGDLVSVTDPAGQVTSYTYDGAGRQTQQFAPRSDGTHSTLETDTVYDADDNVTAVCNPRQWAPTSQGGGGTTPGPGACTGTGAYSSQSTYDVADNPVMVANPGYGNGQVTTTYTYDADGNPLTSNGPIAGHVTTNTYNLLDQATQTTDPAGISSYTLYDPSGQTQATMVDTTAADNVGVGGAGQDFRITGYTYDTDNRPVDTVTGLQVASATPPTDNGAVATALTTDLPVSGTSGHANSRTRALYDADGDVIGTYAPNAFTSSLTSPNQGYLTATSYDVDNRPIDFWSPRYTPSGATNDPNDPTDSSAGDDSSTGSGFAQKDQYNQCPTSRTDQLPPGVSYTGVHVCETTDTYDADSNVLAATSALGSASTQTYSYSLDNLLLTDTSLDPSSSSGGTIATATYNYDADGRPTREEDAAGLTNCASYNGDGTISTEYTDSNAACTDSTHEEDFAYDADGNVLTDTVKQVSLAAGGSPVDEPTTSTYYPADVVKSESSPAPDSSSTDTSTTNYAYNNDGDITSESSPDAVAGDPANAQGLPTVTSYSADDRVTAVYTPYIAAAGQTAKWRRTEYTYDKNGDDTQSQNDTVTASSSYPTDPTQATVSNAGGSQSYSYYPDGLLNTETGRSSGESIADQYDSNGNLTQTTDTEPAAGSGSNQTAAYTSTDKATYYLDGLVRSAAASVGSTVQSSEAASYNADGSITAFCQSTAGCTTGGGTAGDDTTTYSYDGADLPTSEIDPSTGDDSSPAADSWGWTYDQDARLATQTNPNSTKTTFAYTSNEDTLSSATTINTNNSAQLATDSYTYNAADQVLSQTAQAGSSSSATDSYTYFRSGAVASSTNGGEGTKSYTYDHNANRLTATSPTGTASTYAYNADDSICYSVTGSSSNACSNAPSGAHVYSYNGAGDLTDDGCSTYRDDGFDRTAAVTNDTSQASGCSSNPAETYDYDGYNRQISSITTPTGSGPVQTQTTNYALTGSAINSQTDSSTGSPAGISGTTRYVLDASQTPLALNRTNNAGTGAGSPPAGMQFLLQDGRDSVTAVLNASTSSPSVVCAQRYDPYGLPDGYGSGTPPTACTESVSADTYGYNTVSTDRVTGDQQLGARTYSPATASYTSPDSYGPGTGPNASSIQTDPLTQNTYTYVNGDPLNLDDPDGHVNEPLPTGCSGSLHYCHHEATLLTHTIDRIQAQQAAAAEAKAQAKAQAQAAASSGCGVFHPLSCADDVVSGVENVAGGAIHVVHDAADITTNFTVGFGAGVLNTATGLLTVGHGTHFSGCVSKNFHAACTAGRVTGDIVTAVAATATGGEGLEAADAVAEGGEALDGLEGAADGLDTATGGGDAAEDAEDAESCLLNSFTPSTGVELASGKIVPISSIKVGDRVQSLNLATGKDQSERVTKRWLTRDNALMDVTVKVGGKQSVIHDTAHHLIYDTTQHGWVETHQLRPGDRLRAASVRRAPTVVRTRVVPGARDMWDLTVQGTHDFYVHSGDVTALVHNCDTDMEHILERHGPGTEGNGAGTFGQGTSTQDIQSMIDETIQKGAERPNTMGRPGSIFERQYNSPIGTNGAGAASSSLRVVVGAFGQVVTAFPY